MSYGRWFRFYDEALNDGKVQLLRSELFKVWVNLLCLSSKHGGNLPNYDQIAYALRISRSEAEGYIAELDKAGLIDWTEPTCPRMHEWDNRQFRSDSSTDRVHKFREEQRKKEPKKEIEPDTEQIQIQSGNVSRNGNETLHETVLKRFTETLTLGEFENVVLSRDEYEKLKKQFTAEGAQVWIEELSIAIASKGLKYKSHYATIKNWARYREGKQNGHKNKQDRNAEAARRLLSRLDTQNRGSGDGGITGGEPRGLLRAVTAPIGPRDPNRGNPNN